MLQRGVFPEQATGSVNEWLGTETRQGVAEGTVEINGREWTRMVGDPQPDERRSLVHSEAGTLTVVTGSADWAELAALATSLVPGGCRRLSGPCPLRPRRWVRSAGPSG